ncbi:hypothetical protein DFJ77DRAFT_277949 [Powellomyces hirtus]|nr:hypothetical protein DFJ77DRAFT_277949 [Powellomyces hirtus]
MGAYPGGPTHGQPSERNSHPHRSDPKNECVVVHNGIITNYMKGYVTESEPDAECVAKLGKYLFDSQMGDKALTFTALTKAVIRAGRRLCAHSQEYSLSPMRWSPLVAGRLCSSV